MVTARVPARFVPERTYVLRVLVEVCLQGRLQVIAEERDDVAICLPGGQQLVLADAFWRHCEETTDYLFRAPLPGAPQPLSAQTLKAHHLPPNVVALYGNSELRGEGTNLYLGADLLASAFFLLTGWGEWAQLQPGHPLGVVADAHQRYPEAAHWLVVHNQFRRPLVEEYAALLRNWAVAHGYDFPPPPAPTILPTHDTDRWRLGTSPKKRLWINLHQLLLSSRYLHYLKPLRLLGRSNDPYATHGDLRVQAEQQGLQATYFFKATRYKTPYDDPYPLNTPAMRRLWEALAAGGHSVGFHPGYGTLNSKVLWDAELERLVACKVPPTAVRGHFLRERIPETWRWAEQAGLAWDSTRGFSDRNGFRTGMSRPYPLFDFLARREMKLWERPLMFMEVSRLPEGPSNHWPAPDELLQEAAELKANVAAQGGQFVFNWHNDHIRTPPYKPYQKVLRSLYRL